MEIVGWVKEKCTVHLRHSGPCAENPSTKEVTGRKEVQTTLQLNVIWTVIKRCAGCYSYWEQDNELWGHTDGVVIREDFRGKMTLTEEGKYSHGPWGGPRQTGGIRRDTVFMSLVIPLETTWELIARTCTCFNSLTSQQDCSSVIQYSSKKWHLSGNTGLHPSRPIKLWVLAGCPGEGTLFTGGLSRKYGN